MSFLSNLKKVLHFGANDAKKKKAFNNIQMDCDPKETWDMIGELGDGAFGKVYKVRNYILKLLFSEFRSGFNNKIFYRPSIKKLI